jgi:hypothetical protein
MRIKEWIATGILASLAMASPSLGVSTDTGTETVYNMDEQDDPAAQATLAPIKALEEAVAKTEALAENLPETASTRWPELHALQGQLWKAMALDPTFPVLVPPAEVPKSLFANQLNLEITTTLEALKKTAIVRGFDTFAEYKTYLATVEEILKHRNVRNFPQARAIAKRGTLDSQFQLLDQKIGVADPIKPDLIKSIQGIQQQAQSIQSHQFDQQRETQKKNLFGGNSALLWVMLATLVGFFFGIAAYRISPDFFHRHFHQALGGPSDSQHRPLTEQPKTHLNYEEWLRVLEEQLIRFKNSQLHQEKRITEVVQASERVTQQALNLYADARIKSEANLEMRMANLLKETQYQFEQSQRLAQTDRIQIKALLDHCLQLCDAIEGNGVKMMGQSNPPATSKNSSRAA